MMMGGFGSLKAMNDSIKQNREMLKASKKKPFDRNGPTYKREEYYAWHDRKLTEQDRKAIVLQSWQDDKLERRKNLLVFSISLVLVMLLVLGFLAWW